MKADKPFSRQRLYRQPIFLRRAIHVLIILSILTVAVSGLAGTVVGEPALDGDGTEGNPYEITDVDELQAMEEDLSAHYVLVTDIDATGTSDWNGGDGFDPIGDVDARFVGALDGQGHTISNLTIDRVDEEYVGLFGATGSEAEIEDVQLEQVTIYGDEYMGGLVGSNMGTVTGSSASGYFQAREEDNARQGSVHFGGLVGENHGSVTMSYATGELYVPTDGSNSHYYVGGLVGSSDGTVSESFAKVDIESNRAYGVGGLVGKNDGEISNTYATGAVSGRNEVGALVGDNGDDAFVTNSYATGKTEAHFTAGGLVGHNNGNTAGDAGGSEVYDSYWNRESTEQVDGLDNNWGTFVAYPRTTPEMVGDVAESEMAQLNFGGTWETVDETNEFADADGYPILQAIDPEPQIETPVVEHLMDGTGTEADPYQATDLDDLQNVGEYPHRHYQLATDIDATATQDWNGGAGFEPIATQENAFSATFDGDGHTISGLTIDREDDQIGLFAAIHNEGSVDNVTLENVDIYAEFGDVGALAGLSDGTITDIHVSGEVGSGGSDAGGVIGKNTGSVSQSSANVDIEGTWDVGGLIGSNSGPISNSHTVGDLYSTERNVGGLVGEDTGGDITGSYATGDVEASATSGGLVGRTRATTEISHSYATGDVEISGTNAGGLIGRAYGASWSSTTVASNTYATGDVTGNNDVGGLIGYVEDDHVEDSYALGSVTGNKEIGGLVGNVNDEGSVYSSYSVGSVQGEENVGGIIGLNDGDIENLYWDTETSFRTDGIGVDEGTSDEITGLTTSEMRGSLLFDSGAWEAVTSSHEHAEEDWYPILLGLNAEDQIESQKAAESDPSDAYFDVSITDIDEDVYVGQTISITVEIENTGTAGAEQDVRVVVDETQHDSSTVILSPDGAIMADFEYTTSDSELGTLDITVESDNDSRTETVDVIKFMSDTDAGDELWSFQVEDMVESSPTIVNGTVYVGSGGFHGDEETVYAIDNLTGEVEWTFTTENRFESSPFVANGSVYIGDYDGYVYAIDAESGEEEWTYQTDDGVHSSPVVTGGVLYVGSEDGNLYAIDAESGEEVWTFETDDDILASPAVTSSMVYIPSTDGTLYALDRSDGKEQWNRTSDYGLRSSPTLANGTLYYNDAGIITAVDASTGQILWEFAPGDRRSSSHHTPTVAYGTVYQYDRSSGQIYAVDANDGTVKWSEDVSGYSGARYVSPTVANETVFMGGGEVTALDATDGTVEWTFATDVNVDSSPTVADGVLYVGSGTSIDTEGAVYAIDAGVDGSSEDSRVLHRTLGHHDKVDAVAAFMADPREPVPGEQFTFTAEQSLTFNEYIDEYRWDLTDDGEIDETTTSPHLDHEFESPGTYDVGLEIEDNTGETASTTTSVVVSERGTLTGQVTDENGDPVEEATLKLLDGNVFVGTDETDADGEYEIDARTGTFTLEMAADGFISHVEPDVTISADETISVDITPLDPGSGTVDEPYRITDVDGLQDIQSEPDAHYELVNDIDASETENWNDGAGFDPIGYEAENYWEDDQFFTGSFDGQGHEISGLTIDRPDEDEVGLFHIVEGATIENVTLSDIDVKGDSWAIGGVAGSVDEGAHISNTEVTGTVAATNEWAWGVGGVAGAVYGDSTVEYGEADVDVSNGYGLGGLVGDLQNSVIRNSSASGHILADNGYAGGLVGYTWDSDDGTSIISNSSASGDVASDGWYGYSGGLIGYNDIDVQSSFASGDVSGTSESGGLIGYSQTGEVTESSAIGTVTGTDKVGGLIGQNTGPVSDAYATGDVSGDSSIGGLIGDNDGDVSETYAAGDVAVTETSGGVVGTTSVDASVTGSYWDVESTGHADGIGEEPGGEDEFTFNAEGLDTDEMVGEAAESNMQALDFTSVWKSTGGYPTFQYKPQESDGLVASFTYDPTEPTVDEDVTFDASDSVSSDGEIVEYRWDVSGDGEADIATTDAVVDLDFELADDYDVTLTVEAENGETATATKPVSVGGRNPDVSIKDVEANTYNSTWYASGPVGVTIEASAVDDAQLETVSLGVESLNTTWETEFEASHSGGDTWDATIDLADVPDDATYELAAQATDNSGLENETVADETLVIDRSPPSLTAAIEDINADQANVSIRSDTDLNSDPPVEVTDPSNETNLPAVGPDGENQWETAVDVSESGEYDINITGTDLAGNDGTATTSVTVQTDLATADNQTILHNTQTGTFIEFETDGDVDSVFAALSENDEAYEETTADQVGAGFLTAALADEFDDALAGATIYVPADVSAVDGVDDPAEVELTHYNEETDEWEPVETTVESVDRSEPEVSGEYWVADVDDFSTYGAIATDDEPPEVTAASPTDGETLSEGTREVSLSIEYEDDASGVDVSTVALAINGDDLTGDASTSITSSQTTHTLGVEDGESYTTELTIADNAGNTETYEQTFTVDEDNGGSSGSSGGSSGGSGGSSGGSGGDTTDSGSDREVVEVPAVDTDDADDESGDQQEADDSEAESEVQSSSVSASVSGGSTLSISLGVDDIGLDGPDETDDSDETADDPDAVDEADPDEIEDADEADPADDEVDAEEAPEDDTEDSDDSEVADSDIGERPPPVSQAEVENVEIDVNQDTDAEVEIRQSRSPPSEDAREFQRDDGTQAAGYVQVNNNLDPDAVDGGRINYRMSKDDLETDDADPENVAMYYFNTESEEWDELPTEVTGETDSHVRFRADTPGFSQFASGIKRAQFEVSDATVDVQEVTLGDSVRVEATITNTGGADGTFRTELLVDSEIVEEDILTIASGGTRATIFDHEFTQPDTYEVRVNNVSTGEITVITPAGSETDDTESFIPGFGFGAAVVSLLVASLAVWRRK